MSQGAAKVTRRAIRRAFGAEAIDTLNAQGDTLGILSAQSGLLRRDLDAHIKFSAREHEAQAAAIRLHGERFARFESMPFSRRLRWLILGR